MTIPFLDLREQYKEVEAEVQAAVSRVLSGGSYILGREVEAFEQEWARFCGVRATAAVNSGTDALTLALIASGAVRSGHQDEVITSPLTAGYTALAIANAGATPVFADIDAQTCTLDPNSVESAITPHTRAILPVHIWGQMAEMGAICEIASRHGLIVIEDAAQAHGARLNDKRAGAHGSAGAFSFYPTKNLGAYGDGGAVASDDIDLIARVKQLRQGGHLPALRAKTVGLNSRLDEIQAAVLRVKLKYVDEWNRRRENLAETYRALLSRSGKTIALPLAREPGAHVYHLYVVQHRERERLRAYLAARGIETAVHYPFLLHEQPLFRSSGHRELPVAERVVGSLISLPLYPQLPKDELETVARAVLAFEA